MDSMKNGWQVIVICFISCSHCIEIAHPVANMLQAPFSHGNMGVTVLFLWKSYFIFMSLILHISMISQIESVCKINNAHTYIFFFCWHTRKLSLGIRKSPWLFIFPFNTINNNYFNFIHICQSSWFFFICIVQIRWSCHLQESTSPIVLHCCCNKCNSENIHLLMMLTFNHNVVN